MGRHDWQVRQVHGQLAVEKLPSLRTLHLDKTDLTPAAMSELARADWPCLMHLNLSENNRCSQTGSGALSMANVPLQGYLDASPLQDMCGMHLLHPRVLSMTHAIVALEGAAWIAQASWPYRIHWLHKQCLYHLAGY